MSLAYIGPVAIGPYEHGNPSFSWDSDPTAGGIRDATIGGLVTWRQAQQLDELANNPAWPAVYVYFASALFAPWSGWYQLRGVSFSPEKRHTMDDTTAPISVRASFLGDRPPKVWHSARAKRNDYGLSAQALIAPPFWDVDPAGAGAFTRPPGGVVVAREYDPAPYDGRRSTASTRSQGAWVADAGSLDRVAFPALPHGLDFEGQATPRWLSDRGGDVQVWDRRQELEVFGPDHLFRATTDVAMTNGALRVWVGGRRRRPYLAVAALRAEAWRHVGCLALATDAALLGARLVASTPDAATIALSIDGQGEATVTLRRWARSVDVVHGSGRPPAVEATRTVAWVGMPPSLAIEGASSGPGHYGPGVALGTSGLLRFTWGDQPKSRWAIAAWWIPTAAASAQASSLLLTVAAATGVAARVTFDSTTKRILFTVGATTITSQVLAFGAGGAVFLAASLDLAANEMALSVADGGAAAQRVTGTPPADAGTTAAEYSTFSFGGVITTTPYGTGPYGSGPYGGAVAGQSVGGSIDNAMLFDGALGAHEAAVLAAATSPLAGLPAPEGRLIWHLPGDATEPAGSAMASGRRFEATVAGGSTAAADAYGLTRALAALRLSVTAAGGLALSAHNTEMEVGAAVVTTDAGDDLAAHQLQLAAAYTQETRIG